MVLQISACHSMKIGILYVQTPIDEKKMYHILKGERKYAFKTYQKITTLFKEHHGYMSFADPRDHQGDRTCSWQKWKRKEVWNDLHAAGTGARTVVMKTGRLSIY